MARAHSSMPRSSVATVRTIGGRQPSRRAASPTSASSWAASRSAPGLSALLSTNTSAISMMPAFMAWTSSPIPGTTSTSVASAVRATSISSWPTPTVSSRIVLNPAASRTRSASSVARASPPSCPRVAMLRMKVPASRLWDCMRIRSPRMAPPLYGLLGSTATIPIRSPEAR